VRNSLIQYIATGQGTSALAPASAEAPETQSGSGEPLVYQFEFPFKEGWYDPASGEAEAGFAGGVNFHYAAHGIDLDAAEPTIQLDGPSSLASFVFTGTAGSEQRPARAVMMGLEPTHAASRVSEGTTIAYTQVPGVVPSGEYASVLAGFYLPGDEFGWITISLRTG
jgi:hypothetical protein